MDHNPQNVIAILTDMDLTLTPEYSELPLFQHFDHDPDLFWKENEETYRRIKAGLTDESLFPEELRANPDMRRAGPCYEITYAQTILDHVNKGCPTTGQRWTGLSRRLLRELGKKIIFFPGLPDAIAEEKEFIMNHPEFKKHDITLEWHIISTAMHDMIVGSDIGRHVDGIFACEFAPAPGDDPVDGEINRLVFPVTYTEKTRFIHMANKGFDVDVNSKLPHEFRRIPGENMTYIGDGQSDVPPMSTVNNMGGRSIAVYTLEDRPDGYYFRQAYELRVQDRAFVVAPADYQQGSLLRKVIRQKIEEDGHRCIKRKMDALRNAMRRAPKHYLPDEDKK